MTKTKLQEGDPAPPLELPDQDGTVRALAQLRGDWVLVYFYPRDDTPGCTTEACGIRDAWSTFRRRKLRVLGVSTDSVKSHRRFADKYGLPFPLLADEDKRAVRTWGVWGKKKFMGREFEGTLRTSFLVDPRGRIAQVYPKVRPAEHAEEVLADVARGGGSGRSAAPARPARKAGPTKKAGGAKKAKAAKKAPPARKAEKARAARRGR